MIQFWAEYWKKKKRLTDEVDPLLIKAMIAAESSFRPGVRTKDPRSTATGLMQITSSTLRTLKGNPDRKGYIEVRHYPIELENNDRLDPLVNIATGIRWLGHKIERLPPSLKPKDINKRIFNGVKYYHSWDQAGEEYVQKVYRYYNATLNKYVLGVMTVVLMSCSHITHIVYNGDDISEDTEEETYFEEYPKSYRHPKKEKYKQIYCTPEDERKGIKDTIDFLHVACGRSKIQPVENRTLEIERVFLGAKQMPSGDMLLGHHLLFLKDGDKVLQKIQVEREGYDPFWREVVFVKIRKDVYWQDLNNDGKLEFAVLKTDSGYSSHRTADLYTLEADSFKFYGHGTYVWTTGEHVLLNCPKDCRHNNHDACSECL